MPRTARWIALALVASAAPAQAQLVGSNATSTGTGSSINGSAGVGSAGTSLPTANPAFTAPAISGLDTTQPLQTGILSPSNIFGGYYANTYYAGRAGAVVGTLPGGFGTSLYGGNLIPTNTVGSNTNAFSAAAGASPVSSASGFGGGIGTNQILGGGTFGGVNNGQGGFGGANNAQGGFGGNQRNQAFQTPTAGVIVPLPVPISYTAKLMFASPPITASQVAVDVRTVIDRTNSIARPGMIDVFTDGQLVVLRGTVTSEQEAQTAEGLARLTPGVRDVRNELKVVPLPVARTPAP